MDGLNDLFPLPSDDPLGTDIQLDDNGDIVPDISGSLETVSDETNVQQALRVGLTTIPDNYLWDDDIGTYLASYVDAPITADLEQEIISIVTETALQDDRIMDVSQVIIDSSHTDTLIIFVSATVSDEGDMTIPITVTGGA